ncbi:hypothetical protein BDD12DRAFT_979016 [Trichophaea hybrida]|nr:hypothetical protein BDD12DRAFT_979016 [Trichophaea hybrida]
MPSIMVSARYLVPQLQNTRPDRVRRGLILDGISHLTSNAKNWVEGNTLWESAILGALEDSLGSALLRSPVKPLRDYSEGRQRCPCRGGNYWGDGAAGILIGKNEMDNVVLPTFFETCVNIRYP